MVIPPLRRRRGVYYFTLVRRSVRRSVTLLCYPYLRNYTTQKSKILYIALYMYDVLWDSFSDPSDIHFLFTGNLIFPIQSCTKFFVTEFSATIHCRLLIFYMKLYICMMYRGIHFQIHRTYTFCLPTTENFHRQCLCAQFFVTLFSASDWQESGSITLWSIRPQCTLVLFFFQNMLNPYSKYGDKNGIGQDHVKCLNNQAKNLKKNYSMQWG